MPSILLFIRHVPLAVLEMLTVPYKSGTASCGNVQKRKDLAFANLLLIFTLDCQGADSFHPAAVAVTLL